MARKGPEAPRKVSGVLRPHCPEPSPPPSLNTVALFSPVYKPFGSKKKALPTDILRGQASWKRQELPNARPTLGVGCVAHLTPPLAQPAHHPTWGGPDSDQEPNDQGPPPTSQSRLLAQPPTPLPLYRNQGRADAETSQLRGPQSQRARAVKGSNRPQGSHSEALLNTADRTTADNSRTLIIRSSRRHLTLHICNCVSLGHQIRCIISFRPTLL